MQQYLPPLRVQGRLITKKASKQTMTLLMKTQNNIPLGTNMLNNIIQQISLNHHQFYFYLSNKMSTAQQFAPQPSKGVKTQIQNSRLQLQPIQSMVSRSKVQNTKKSPNKLHQIIRKKQQLQIELSRIKLQEQSIKEKRQPVMAQSELGKTKYFRSTITSEEKKKISKIINQTNHFQKEAVEKTNRLLEKIQKLEAQEKVLKQKQHLEQVQIKKQTALQKIKEIKERKQTRTKMIAEANKSFQKVSKQKCLHEEISNKWKIVEATQEEENGKVMAKKKQSKRFNIEEIKSHSRRYSQIVNTHRQERQENTKKIRKQIIQNSRMSHYPSSTFFKVISEEEDNKKRKNMEKTQQISVFRNRLISYGQTVRELNNSPNSKAGSNPITDSHRIDIRSAQSLDNLGKHKLGNEYMKNIHSNIGQVLVNSKEVVEGNKNSPKVFKYPNYLTEIRHKKSDNPEHECQQLKQIKKILKKDQDEETKLFRAKLLVQKLDQKSGSKSLVDSIYAKLSVIEEFSNSLK